MSNSAGQKSINGSSSIADKAIFDPNLKIKEEQENEAEHDADGLINKKYGHLFPQGKILKVKMEAIKGDSLMRFSSSQKSTKSPSKQGGLSTKPKNFNGLLHGRYSDESAGQARLVSKNINKNIQLPQKLNNNLQRAEQTVHSVKVDDTSIKRPLKSTASISSPFRNNLDRRDGTLKPDDLRHVISAYKVPFHGVIQAGTSAVGQETGEDGENEIDSMSIHADDDDDLDIDNSSDLNELGKHFAATDFEENNNEQETQISKTSKRRNSDIDCESGKKRRVNGPQKEFSRSKSLNASQERNEGVQNNGKFGQSPAKNGNKKKNEGQIDRDRDHSDEARKSNTLKNDASRSQNERNYFHALPYLGSKGQADLQMKIPKLQNRENGMESRNGRENYAARPNNRWQHMANRSREVVFRPNGPCLRPSFMQDSRFPMPLSFYPHVPLIRTSQMMPMPVPPIDMRNQDIRGTFPRPGIDIGINSSQMFQLLDLEKENDFEKCMLMFQERKNQPGKTQRLELLMKKAAQEDVQNLTSDAITSIFDLIRKERATSGFKIEDFQYAIEAFVKVEDASSAIDVVLDMKNQNFKPQKNTLVSIRNSIFTSSIKDADCLIKFCDLLETHNLITGRLLKEVLNYVPFDVLRAKTSSQKVLEVLQELESSQKDLASPRLQPTTPIFMNDFTCIVKQIDDIIPQECIPPELVVKLMGCVKEPSQAPHVITKLSFLPKEVLGSVPSEAWNGFFVQSCSGPHSNMQYANQIHGIITDIGIKVSIGTLLEFARLLLKDGKHMTAKAAIDIFDRIQVDDVTEDDVTNGVFEFYDRIIGSKKLMSVLADYKVAMILIKAKRILSDEKLIAIIESLRMESYFQEIHDIILELTNAAVVPSLQIYKSAVSALEDWNENQEAFFRVFRLMKGHYPEERFLRDNEQKIDSVRSNSSCCSTSERSVTALSINQATGPENSQICKYFLAKIPCLIGSQCRFSHSVPALPLKSPFGEVLNSQRNLKDVGNGTLPSAVWDSHVTDHMQNDVLEQIETCEEEQADMAVEMRSTRSISTDSTFSQKYRSFYNKLVCASKSDNHDGTCQLYAEMRNDGLQIDKGILHEIYKALVSGDSIDNFESLLKTAKEKIVRVQEIDDDDNSDNEFLQEDQEHLGRLGVRLMFYFIEKNEMDKAYSLLLLLHASNIDYFHYGQAFDGGLSMTISQVAVAAVKICLSNDKPDEAMTVLTSVDFGTPLETEDDSERREVLSKLAECLLDKEEYRLAYDLMKNSDNRNGWSLDANYWFNATLLRLSGSNIVDKAVNVYKFIEEYKISLRHDALRAYLSCHAQAGNIDTAREVFLTGCELEVYPSQECSDVYLFECPCHLTSFEMLFMIEKHLLKMRRSPDVGKETIKPLMRSQSSFKIVFKENYELFESAEEQVAVAKRNMVYVLTELIKPPLKIREFNDPYESLVIGVNSILGWYEGRTPVNGLLSVTSNFDNSSVQRTVQMRDTNECNGESQPEDATSTVATHGTVAETRQKIAMAVCERAKHFLNIGKVEPGETFQECCRTLSRLYFKYNTSRELTNDENWQSKVSSFVDNFFKEHGTFVLQR